MDKTTGYYDGYRYGRIDKALGLFSVIASTWPEYSLPGYAKGYLDGWHDKYKEIRQATREQK